MAYSMVGWTSRMNRSVAWGVIACLIVGGAYVLWNDPKARFLSLFVPIACAVLLAVGCAAISILDRVRSSRATKEFEAMLGDQTLESVLEKSVFTYVGAGQGSGSYFVMKKEGDHEPIAVLPDEVSAQQWIVREFVATAGN